MPQEIQNLLNWTFAFHLNFYEGIYFAYQRKEAPIKLNFKYFRFLKIVVGTFLLIKTDVTNVLIR